MHVDPLQRVSVSYYDLYFPFGGTSQECLVQYILHALSAKVLKIVLWCVYTACVCVHSTMTSKM